MFRLGKSSFVVIALALGACANTGSNFVPVVDGPVGPNFANDLAACQQLARSQPVISGSTAAAAATGAGVAAAGTAIINNRGSNVRDAAAVGAILGATSNAVQQSHNQEVIIRNCMRGRGHNVVG